MPLAQPARMRDEDETGSGGDGGGGGGSWSDWGESEGDLLLEPFQAEGFPQSKGWRRGKGGRGARTGAGNASCLERLCCGCSGCCVRRCSRRYRRVCCVLGCIPLLGLLVATILWTQYPLFSSCTPIPASFGPSSPRNVSALAFTEGGLRVNQVTIAGTHNSYHRRSWLSFAVSEWAYSFPSYAAQLEEGVRAFEVDFHYSRGIFSVYHLPFLDQGTNARCVSDILVAIRQFSDANPCHFPISISFEPKYEIDFHQYCKHVDGGRVLLELQSLITSIIPRSRIITPLDIRGNFSTLREAIVQRGWPDLESARGLFLLNLNLDIYSNACRKVYDVIPIEDQLFFPRRQYEDAMEPGMLKDDASMIELYKPWDSLDDKNLVRSNFYVRGYVGNAQDSMTRAIRHVNLTMHAGMHILATDDYSKDFVPKGVLCNSINTVPDCAAQLKGLSFGTCER